MAPHIAHLSIGIAATAGPDVARTAARAAEDAGLHALWVNDTPAAEALELLAAAAAVTDRLVLATGVLPVDRRPADEVAARVAALGLPVDRLMLGVGSGQLRRGALARVEADAARLREDPAAPVVVGALGPRMRSLGAERADGLLLSWLTPEIAARQAAEAHALSPRAHVALYARTAVDEDAVPRLRREAERYASFPAYTAHFARLGVDPGDTVITPDRLAGQVAEYRAGVDELVLRAMTAVDEPLAIARFVESVAAAAT